MHFDSECEILLLLALPLKFSFVVKQHLRKLYIKKSYSLLGLIKLEVSDYESADFAASIHHDLGLSSILCIRHGAAI